VNGLLLIVGAIFLFCAVIGYVRGFVRIVASLAATIITILLVAFMTPYLSNMFSNVFPIEKFAQSKCEKILQMGKMEDEQEPEYSRDEQISLIEDSDLPVIFKQMLLENNNAEIYEILGVNTFGQYITSYLTRMMSNIFSFLLAMLVITIVVRTALYVLGIISDLPIIGGINRLAGGALGLGLGLVVVWMLFIAITMFYDTQFGKICFADIADNEFLKFLYENNILLNFITKFRA